MPTLLDRDDSPPATISGSSRLHAVLRAAWCAIALLIAAGSLAPASTMLIRAVDSLRIDDLLIHLSAYFLLSLLPALHERPVVAVRMAAFALVIGFAIECGQIFVVDRTFQWDDAAVDAAGVVCGASSGRVLRRLLDSAAAR